MSTALRLRSSGGGFCSVTCLIFTRAKEQEGRRFCRLTLRRSPALAILGWAGFWKSSLAHSSPNRDCGLRHVAVLWSCHERARRDFVPVFTVRMSCSGPPYEVWVMSIKTPGVVVSCNEPYVRRQVSRRGGTPCRRQTDARHASLVQAVARSLETRKSFASGAD